MRRNGTYYAADVSALPASAKPQRWLLPLIVVVLCLMVGGGLLAREVYRVPDLPPPAVLAPPTSDTRAPGPEPGNDIVKLTPDAAGHPLGEAVRRVLQTYFDSINERNYTTYSTTVTRKRLSEKKQGEWLHDFQSTTDGSVLVYRIEAAGAQNLRVLLGFTSVQDSGDAPAELPGASCIRWRLALPMALENNSWRVDSVAGYAPPEASKC